MCDALQILCDYFHQVIVLHSGLGSKLNNQLHELADFLVIVFPNVKQWLPLLLRGADLATGASMSPSYLVIIHLGSKFKL